VMLDHVLRAEVFPKHISGLLDNTGVRNDVDDADLLCEVGLHDPKRKPGSERSYRHRLEPVRENIPEDAWPQFYTRQGCLPDTIQERRRPLLQPFAAFFRSKTAL